MPMAVHKAGPSRLAIGASDFCSVAVGVGAAGMFGTGCDAGGGAVSIGGFGGIAGSPVSRIFADSSARSFSLQN